MTCRCARCIAAVAAATRRVTRLNEQPRASRRPWRVLRDTCKLPNQRLGECRRPRRAAEVAGAHLPLGQHRSRLPAGCARPRRLSPRSFSISTAGRISGSGLARSAPIASRLRPEDRFVHAHAVGVHDAGRAGDPADQPGAEVAEQVAVQVAGRQHLELLRPAHQLHAGVVDDHFLRRDLRELPGDPPEAVEEQPVGQLQDVRLVDAVDRLAALPHGQLEGEAEEPQAGGLGHDLEALHHAGDDLVLAGGVQVLGDLADEDEVDAA